MEYIGSERKGIQKSADILLDDLQMLSVNFLDFFLDFSVLLYDLNISGENSIVLDRKNWQGGIYRMFTENPDIVPEGYPAGEALQAADQRCISAVIKVLEETAAHREELYENSSEIFAYMLQSMIDRRMIQDFITPLSLSHMMARMLAPKSGDAVLDPACGSGRLLAASFEQCRECRLTGIDINPGLAGVAFFNLYFHGKGSGRFYSRDFFEYSADRASCFDVIVSNPPYTDDINLTIAFIGEIMKLLRPGGRCAILVPEGFLTVTANLKVVNARRELLDRFSLEGVISLPKKIYKPYTESNSSLLIIGKYPAHPDGKVFMSRLPEYDGPETGAADSVYQEDMERIIEAWQYYRGWRGDGKSRRYEEIFWEAAADEIRDKEYIFAADTYRPSEYSFKSVPLERLCHEILTEQQELEELWDRYMDEEV